MNAGSSFSDSIRSSSRPSSAARSRASTSMSQRISRWSETKPTGHTSTRRTPRAVEAVELLEDVGAEPRLAGRDSRSGTRTTSVRAPARSATRRAVSSSWSWYGSPVVEDPRGQAVRREDDVRRPCRARGRRGRRERLVVVPALDEAELGAAGERSLEPLAVALRSTGASSAARARGRRSARRRPRAPARRPRRSAAASASSRRRTGMPSSRSSAARCASVIVVERRAADRSAGSARPAPRPLRPRSACPRGCPRGRRARPRAARRAAVGHQHDRACFTRRRFAVCSCTSSTSRPGGRVGVGQHAVAEVEDVARPAAGRLEDRRAPPPRRVRSNGPSSSAGSRLPWTPRSWPTRSQPSSSGTRQSSPITSPPASAIAASRCAVPVPKWIVGTSTDGEDARRVGRDELLVVGPRERADPGVEELDRRRRRRATFAAQVGDRRSRSASPSARARPPASRTCSASSSTKSRVGLPSTR